MKFLEYFGIYLISGSVEANLILGFISFVILSFLIVIVIEAKLEKKDKVKKEFEELEKRCGTMH